MEIRRNRHLQNIKSMNNEAGGEGLIRNLVRKS